MPRPSSANTILRSTTCARAERLDRNGITIERTRVLIARRIARAGQPARRRQGCCRRCCRRRTSPTRADALAERARLRSRSTAAREALADLREADAIYARLKLDFNRIDTSSALALALLAAGDVPAAGRAADTAVAIRFDFPAVARPANRRRSIALAPSRRAAIRPFRKWHRSRSASAIAHFQSDQIEDRRTMGAFSSSAPPFSWPLPTVARPCR